jgi:putative GTP pyrophosphokinase
MRRWQSRRRPSSGCREKSSHGGPYRCGMAYSKSRVDRAGRVVADQMRAAMEDASDFAPSAEIGEAIQIIEWWRSQHAKPLSRVAANLRYYVAMEGDPIVAQRLKRTPTIADKLLREKSMRLSRMADIGGVRAVLPNQVAAYKVASRLRKNWTITRFRDYVAEPKADGYRGLHLINRNHGQLVEIQLRTPRQDDWANLVETLSRTAAPGLKFGDGPQELRNFLIDAAARLAEEDQGLTVDPTAVARIRDGTIHLVKLLFGDADES